MEGAFFAAPGHRCLGVSRLSIDQGQGAARIAGSGNNRAALVAADLEDAVFDNHLAFGLPVFRGFTIEEPLPVLDLVPLGLVVLVLVKPGRGFLVSGLTSVVVEETEQAALGQRIRVVS